MDLYKFTEQNVGNGLEGTKLGSQQLAQKWPGCQGQDTTQWTPELVLAVGWENKHDKRHRLDFNKFLVCAGTTKKHFTHVIRKHSYRKSFAILILPTNKLKPRC